MTLRRAWDEERTCDIKYQTTQISFLLATRGQGCVNIEIQISTDDRVETQGIEPRSPVPELRVLPIEKVR